MLSCGRAMASSRTWEGGVHRLHTTLCDIGVCVVLSIQAVSCGRGRHGCTVIHCTCQREWSTNACCDVASDAKRVAVSMRTLVCEQFVLRAWTALVCPRTHMLTRSERTHASRKAQLLTWQLPLHEPCISRTPGDTTPGSFYVTRPRAASSRHASTGWKRKATNPRFVV